MEDSMSFTYEFKGSKPSWQQVYNMAKHAAEIGHRQFSIIWGEGWIDIDLSNNQFYGRGWIKNIDGDEIAQLLNETVMTSPSRVRA